MLSREVEIILDYAINIAKRERHEFVTPEHLLLALLEDNEFQLVLKGCGGSLKLLKQDLEDHLKKNIPRRKEGVQSSSEMENLLPDAIDPSLPQITLAFRRVIQRAVVQVQSSGKDIVTPSYLFIALYEEKDSFAVYFLLKQNITRINVAQFVSHGMNARRPALKPGNDPHQSGDSTGTQSALDLYAVNLNEKAKKGKIDPLIGRDDIVERMVQTLSRRTKNNPLLIGDPGVGKTAIVEGLALRITQGLVPVQMQNAVVYAVDMGLLLAGTKFRGDFEERLKNLVTAIQDVPNGILFIDEIHTLVGAGGTQGGALDASNLLKPALANGELSCIGSTTFKEYRTHFEKDRSLARRFQKIEVEEPSIEDAVKILTGLKKHYEDFHKVHYTNPAIRSAVELSVRHLPGRFLPDKAIDVLDEAGARMTLTQKTKGKRVISVTDIENTVATMARIPSQNVSSNDKMKLKSLASNLKLLIFGQDEAVDLLATAIKVARSGLGNAQKPTGSFLFAGPTGVGKTEVSKQLAKALGVHFLRFDMSEYMEKHAVSRLVGAPPGYVGFEEGGLLTEAITKNPYSILLMDEIEKAHPDLINILLQVMDNGTLTDTNGRSADFRNVILIMTTNAGARETAKSEIGIVPGTSKSRFMEAIKQTFSPEFINRLDAVVPFSELTEDIVLQVVGRFLMELETQLMEKKIELEVSESARKFLVTKGYDKAYGARPMGRAIQDFIKRPLVDEILFGELARGGKVKIDHQHGADKLSFEFAPARDEKLAIKVGGKGQEN